MIRRGITHLVVVAAARDPRVEDEPGAAVIGVQQHLRRLGKFKIVRGEVENIQEARVAGLGITLALGRQN